MCNTNNTELIRQQLWCDVYVELVKSSNNCEPSKGANLAISEFDKSFQFDVKELDSYIAERDKRNKLFHHYQELRHKEGVKTVQLPSVFPINFTLEKCFGENYYCDVSSVADKKRNVAYYAGLGIDGVETLAFIKLEE